MRYVVYCDESRHDSSGKCLTIGGLWVPRERKEELTWEFQALRAEVGLRGEVKWSKVSASRLDAYKRLVDFFFDHPELRFRVIVVDQEKLDCGKFHGGDRELGFYKFYYEMLEKWIEAGHEYLILLDHQTNKDDGRYTTLRRYLETKMLGKAWISDLTVIDSHQSPLAQLNDLLTGAVAAAWCGMKAESAKAELVAYLGKRRKAPLLVPNAGPSATKFNIFKINLQ